MLFRSLQADFANELQSLIEHLAGALGVPVSSIDVDIPKGELAVQQWPKLPKLELCEGTLASVNGLPFAKLMDNGDTVPIGFRPPASRRSLSSQQKSGKPGAMGETDTPKGTATIGPVGSNSTPVR